MMILFAAQQRRHRHFEHSGGRRGWEYEIWGEGGIGENSIETHTLPYIKIDSQGELHVFHREPKASAL